jgi:hypothetical protein
LYSNEDDVSSKKTPAISESAKKENSGGEEGDFWMIFRLIVFHHYQIIIFHEN